jgi:hypothetical protein
VDDNKITAAALQLKIKTLFKVWSEETTNVEVHL